MRLRATAINYLSYLSLVLLKFRIGHAKNMLCKYIRYILMLFSTRTNVTRHISHLRECCVFNLEEKARARRKGRSMIDGSRAHLSSRVTSKNRQRRAEPINASRWFASRIAKNRSCAGGLRTKILDRYSKMLNISPSRISYPRSFFIVLNEPTFITLVVRLRSQRARFFTAFRVHLKSGNIASTFNILIFKFKSRRKEKKPWSERIVK